MSHYRSENPDCKVYVGELDTYATKQDVEDAFAYYGPIRNVWVARNPPGFAFVEFEDVRDAEDAVKEVDGGRTVCGKRVRVERAGDKRGGGGRGFRRPFRGGGRRGRSYRSEDSCYECGMRGHYARECRRRGGGRGGRSYSRSRSRSNSRDRRSRDRRSRSRDRRSRSKGHRSHSDSSSRSRSPSRSRNNKSRSRSIPRHKDRSSKHNKGSVPRDKSVSRSKTKSKSPSPKAKEKREVNGDSSV